MTTWILLGFALLLGALLLLFALMRAATRADRANERLFERDKRWLADVARQRAASPPRLERARGSERGWSRAAVPGRRGPRRRR
jgi:hypothetical protein